MERKFFNKLLLATSASLLFPIKAASSSIQMGESSNFIFTQNLNLTQSNKKYLIDWPAYLKTYIQKYQLNPLRAIRLISYFGNARSVLFSRCVELNSSINPLICLFNVDLQIINMLSELLIAEPKYKILIDYLSIVVDSKSKLLFNMQDKFDIDNHLLNKIFKRLMSDGSEIKITDYSKFRNAGGWQPTYPLNAVNPLEGAAIYWKLWLYTEESYLEKIKPPYLKNTDSYNNEVMKVYDVSLHLTNAQKKIAEQWNLENGTVTPAGVWWEIYLEQASIQIHDFELRQLSGNDNDLANLNKLLILKILHEQSILASAMHDALVVCWKVKIKFWTERPITAIRRSLDSQFVSLLVTPSFPSFVSGHATISAAAAQVLASFYPVKAQLFQSKAIEAANSRLFGGIHFDFDNQQGLLLGVHIANTILKRTTFKIFN
jgi:hypothetical protein